MMRHPLSTRIWHWLNFICLVGLFMSGLNISNAHQYLYWGEWGFAPEQAWLHVPRFPGWMTIPDYYNLAVARDWHLLMAWPFALSLLFIWIAMMANGHFRRDLSTSWHEWKPHALWNDIVHHAKLSFDRNGGRYNFLQRAAYGVVLGILLPGMVLTGMAISPGVEGFAPWLNNMFFGRQSARSLHFVFGFLLLAFFVIHIVMVMLTDPARQIREMIFGGKQSGGSA